MARKKRNYIKALKDHDGNWHSQDSILGNLLQQYLQSLFTSASFNTYLLANLHFNQLNIVDYSMLNSPFTKKEVHCALHQLRKWKAPGLDDLPIGFYIDNWCWFIIL